MVKILKWVTLHALMMACLCWGMFGDVEWAQNVVLFLVWFSFVITLMILPSEALHKELRDGAARIPHKIRVIYWIVFTSILAAFGWFWTAGAYTFSSVLTMAIIYRDDDVSGEVTPEVPGEGE